MSEVKDTITINVKDFNELIRVISEMNKKYDENHAEFINQLKSTNAEHEKRYNEFYRIFMSVIRELKKSVADHDTRIGILEKKLERLEEFVNAR
jgi:predicted RNase H-like nuclease (RuvC/YqgF family)